jgi:hypothetical protein
MGADFDFSRYMALSLDHIVEDLTEFSIATWVFVLVFKAIEGGIASAYRNCSDPTYNSYKDTYTGSYVPMDPIENCTDKTNFVWAGIGIELGLQTFNICVYLWGFMQEKSAMKTAESLMNDTPPHKDDSVREFPKSIIDDRYPMRVLQAISFTVSYGFAQKVAARRIYANEFGGRYGNHLKGWQAACLILLYFVLWVVQNFIQSETVLKCTTVLALPPYVDEGNIEIAEAVAHASKSTTVQDFTKAAEVLGLPKDMLEEHLMEAYLESQEVSADVEAIEEKLEDTQGSI